MAIQSGVSEQSKKIHPYKFLLWVAIGSMVMMFAGFTSAYIVKRNQINWQGFDLPPVFFYSTIILVLSSLTMFLSVRFCRNRQMAAYRRLLLLTTLLGVIFIILQFAGFNQLGERGIKLLGQGSNVAGSFVAVIAGMHILHVLGGIIAFVAILAKAKGRVRNYSSMPVEVAATYWHFVDLLWLYLFIFFTMVN